MIKKCIIEDLKRCTDFTYKFNSKPESSSAYCCKKYESIYDDFKAMMNSEEHIVLGYFEGDELKGVLGLSIDVEKQTVDCVGPFIEGDDFVDKAKDMLGFAKTLFRESTCFNFFFDKRNTAYLALMNLIMAEDKGNECILILHREDFMEKEYETQIVIFKPEYTKEFMTMHDNIFPGVYVSSKDILDSLGNTRSLFCVIENEVLLAYTVLKHTKNSSAVTVEIIGVDEDHRGKGYGKALLNAVLKQAFSDSSVKTANLVVENMNTNAMRLYYSFGFELEVENYSYCIR